MLTPAEKQTLADAIERIQSLEDQMSAFHILVENQRKLLLSVRVIIRAHEKRLDQLEA